MMKVSGSSDGPSEAGTPPAAGSPASGKPRSDVLMKLSGGIIGLVVLLVIMVAANVIIGSVRLRTDLTEEGLYTLSDGTRNLLKKLDRNVTLKLFFSGSSKDTPVYLKNYARQVEDLLHEYRMAGKNITIEKHDPKPDSDAEEWAQRYGISGQSIGMFGPPVYFGLVADSGGTEGVIPALDPRQEQLLEYNITRLIYRVANPEKPVIGVLSSLPVMGSQQPPFAMPGQPRPPQQPAWIALQELRADFEVREIPTSAETIEGDVDALVVIHPKNFSDKLLYAIDQYVLGGGKALVCLDPFSTIDMQNNMQPQQFSMPNASSEFGKLLGAWGVGFDPSKVLADSRAVSRLRGQGNRVEESLVFLSLGTQNINKDEILTSQLDSLMMPFAGTFEDTTDEGLTMTPLVESSSTACLVGAMSARFGGQAVRSEFKPGGTQMNLAVRLTGTFKTAFPDGAPKDDGEGDEEEKEEVAEGRKEGESTVLLVGDTDLVYDRYCVQEMNFFGMKAHQPLNDNLNFFANMVEQISGSSDLIGIRSRGKFSRPFTRVDQLEQDARSQWQAKEDELVKKLQDTQQQLNKMQSEKQGNQKYILSPKQKEAIANFRKEEASVKRELKDVRKNLRRGIERLGVKVKVINIALMPVLISLVGVCYGLYRRKRK